MGAVAVLGEIWEIASSRAGCSTQLSGRYRRDQLHKTENTHAGTLVKIALAR
jgi:hypothetical protein